MPMPLKPTPIRYCAYCGKPMERKRMSNGKILSLLHFSRQKYCDRLCMVRGWMQKDLPSTTPRNGRSRAIKRKPQGPCEICGNPNALDVHHKDKDTNNNSPENLQRVCRSCHNKIHQKRKPCLVCGKPQKGLGYCEKHYQRFKKYVDPLMFKRNQHTPLCKSED